LPKEKNKDPRRQGLRSLPCHGLPVFNKERPEAKNSKAEVLTICYIVRSHKPRESPEFQDKMEEADNGGLDVFKI
jgi:hypothetical protein